MFNPKFYRKQGHSQKKTVLKWLEDRGTGGVNSFEGYAHNLPRIAARIYDLRSDGWEIIGNKRKDGSTTYILVAD